MHSRDFRYHLLSIGVNREANGASVRAAERDAFGVSWTFAQLGYWRAERNRCLTGAQSTPQAIDAHLSSCAALSDLDLVMIFWSGHLFHDVDVVGTLSAVADARLRVLIVDTCHADDRLHRIEAALEGVPDDRRPVVLASCAPDTRSRENSINGFFTGALLRQLRRPRRPGVKTLDLLDAFNRAADDAVRRTGREPLFSANGAGRLRLPILAQTALPLEPQ
ncbi:MAG TPA: caspase family protein [Vicinamibacterales bacterium]|nr:caspase family protein [Vicinamibacterales bacterium]